MRSFFFPIEDDFSIRAVDMIYDHVIPMLPIAFALVVSTNAHGIHVDAVCVSPKVDVVIREVMCFGLRVVSKPFDVVTF